MTNLLTQGQREELGKIWGGYMHYMMTGLNQLPDFSGVCWRGYNHGSKADILSDYRVGRPIQWGAFTSVTTRSALHARLCWCKHQTAEQVVLSRSVDAAKGFAPKTRVVFKITVTSGRDINAYSFFPQEGEILLSPSHRFTVSSEPREEGGYTFIDLVQMAGNTFVS